MANSRNRLTLSPVELLPVAEVREGNVEGITVWQQGVMVITEMENAVEPTVADVEKQQTHVKAAQVKMKTLEPRGGEDPRGGGDIGRGDIDGVVVDRGDAVDRGLTSRGNITSRS